MRILFAGTPDIAVPTLKALAENFEIGLVLTNPDKRQGRSKKLVPSPVKQAAEDLNLPIMQPERLRGEVLKEVAAYECDVLLCFAYGKIFGPKFLSMFKNGVYNIHPSALPQFRGSSPIQYAILKGLDKTAITIQKLSLQVDAGDICSVLDVPLDKTENTETLTEKISEMSADFAVDTFKKLEKGEIIPYPQKGEVSITSMFSKEDSIIDWSKSAWEIHCQIRALYPWPKACTTYKETTLFITDVAPYEYEEKDPSIEEGTVVEKRKKQGLVIACKDSYLIVKKLQLAGKKELDFLSFVNGNSEIIGSKLG